MLLTLWRRVIVVTMSMQSFVHDIHTTISIEEVFIVIIYFPENLVGIVHGYYLYNDVLNDVLNFQLYNNMLPVSKGLNNLYSALKIFDGTKYVHYSCSTYKTCLINAFRTCNYYITIHTVFNSLP